MVATRVVRNSRLKDFRQCPLKEMLGWRLGYRLAAGNEKLAASDRGTIWHAILAYHYDLIRTLQLEIGFAPGWESGHQDEIADQVYQFIDDHFLKSDHYDVLVWMYTGYLEKWDLDPDWEVLYIERTELVPFIEPSGAKSRYRYQWTSDLVVRDHSMNRQVLVIDNKSNKNLLRQGDIDLDDQYGNYTWAWRRKGWPVFAQYYNGARTDKLKREMVLAERFARVSGFRTDRELREIELDALRTAKAMYSPANLEMPYSAPDPRVCGWKCDFQEVHLAIRKLGVGKLPQILRAHGFEQPAELP